MDAASVMRGFEYYWKHWNVVDQWRRRHHTACEVTHNTIKKMKMETNYHETTEIAVSVDSFEEDESDSIVNNDEHIKSFVNCYSGICSNYEDYEKDDANDDDDGELELEFVINDEMIAFFQQSMIHKMELKKQRELEMKNGDVGQKQNMKVGKKSKNNKMENDNSLKKNKNISSTESLAASNEIQFPNVTAKKQKRMQEMNRLYGDTAPKICGMETAVQLSFNRLCDRNKPVYWPCIPFKP